MIQLAIYDITPILSSVVSTYRQEWILISYRATAHILLDDLPLVKTLVVDLLAG